MGTSIRHNPDGTISVHGEGYRITDRDGAYGVERVRDGVAIASFTMKAPAGRPLVEADPAYADVASAIAEAWCQPRNPFPVQ